MNRFKNIWIVFCFFIFLGGVFLSLWYHHNFPNRETELITIILAIVSVLSSTVAIMIADQQLAKIKVKLEIWSPSDQIIDSNKNVVVFRISNKSEISIDNLVLRMNIPKKLDLFFGGGYETSIGELHEQAQTNILTFKQFEFLDSNGGQHSKLEIRLGLNLDKWQKERVIFVSVLGKKMTSMRFKIEKKHVSAILKSNSSKPYKIEAIK